MQAIQLQSITTAVLFLAGILHTQAATTGGGFRIAEPDYEFSFPRDHGTHPDYKIEWWYLTGHLESQDPVRSFGFQATFFRFGVTPGEARPPDSNRLFGTNQLYLAHMAMLDVKTGTFIYEERFQRENWDAWAEEGRLNVRNGNWTLHRPEPFADNMDSFELRGSILADVLWKLELKPVKPLVIFGANGVSRKGDDPSAASLYLTYPRLSASGELNWRGEKMEVTGFAWMDHEISSSQLDENQVGWDWASIQLNDGREVMLYLLRLESGEPSKWSRLYWIDQEGNTTSFEPADFSWESASSWTSPETGATYPVDWTLSTTDPKTGEAIQLQLRPRVLNQELVGHIGGVNYWEGACEVLDERGRNIGQAYVELTGYDESLSGRLR